MAMNLDTRRAKDVMTKVVVSVGPDDTVVEALGMMADYHITVLPVVDNKNRCVGILSTTDLVDPARWRNGETIDSDNSSIRDKKVCELMTADVESVKRESPIVNVAGTMLRQRIHHLPVVDENQQLLGILSTMDLLAAFSNVHDQ